MDYLIYMRAPERAVLLLLLRLLRCACHIISDLLNMIILCFVCIFCTAATSHAYGPLITVVAVGPMQAGPDDKAGVSLLCATTTPDVGSRAYIHATIWIVVPFNTPRCGSSTEIELSTCCCYMMSFFFLLDDIIVIYIQHYASLQLTASPQTYTQRRYNP